MVGKVTKLKASNKAKANDADNGSARDQLLEAAGQIMREGDTINLSLSELSMRSGLNSALVKYYFGNKQGLMLALLERDMRFAVEEITDLVGRDMSPEKKLRYHLAGVIDTYYRYPYLNRLLMRMIRDCPPTDAANIADQYLKPISRAYAKLVKEGVSQGVFRDVDPQNLYFSITGSADRFFNARLVLRHCYDIDDVTEKMRDDYRQHTIDLIMAGILVH